MRCPPSPLHLRTPLKRLRSLLFVALLGACGAPPVREVAPQHPFSGLPTPALRLKVEPQAFGQLVDGVSARLPGQGDGALGPLGDTLTASRQALLDWLAALSPTAKTTGEALLDLGISPYAPLTLEVMAPDGSALGRVLLARLGGVEAPASGRLRWQARLLAKLADEARLISALDAAAARLGLAGADEPWDDALKLPASARWRARDPETGLTLILRLSGGEAALDLLMPASESAALLPASVADALLRRGPPEALEASPEAVVLTTWSLGMAALAAALEADAALARLPRVAATDAPAFLKAAVAVTGRCTEGLMEQAALSPSTRVALAPDLSLTVETALSAKGEAAWQAALRPLPWAPPESWPAWVQVGLSASAFGALAPGLDEALSDDLSACAVGHPALVGLWSLAFLPAIATHERWLKPLAESPLPEGVGEAGLGLAVLGAAAIEGEPVLTVAAMGLSPAGPLPEGTGPWGAPALSLPNERRFVLTGRVPVVLGVRRLADGRLASAWVAGEGLGAALDAVSPLLSPVFLRAHLSLSALGQALKAAGGDGGALAALGERFGDLSLEGRHTPGALKLRLVTGESHAP